jgi:ATP-dependent Zn protease
MMPSLESSVKKLTSEIYEEVYKIVEENREKVERIARVLMEKEVIYRDELDNLI